MIKEKRSVFLFMDERILEQLENVPYNGKDACLELEMRIGFYKLLMLPTEKENERIIYELEKIKEWGLEKVFIFGVYLYRLGATTSFGIENYSYINYLLGVANLKPVSYSLPFERYFNEYRKALPVFYMFVEKGG